MKKIISSVLISLLASSIALAEDTTLPDIPTLVNEIKKANAEKRITLMNQYKESLSTLSVEDKKMRMAEFKTQMQSTNTGQEVKVQVQQRNQVRTEEKVQTKEGSTQTPESSKAAQMATKQQTRQKVQTNQELRKNQQKNFMKNNPNFIITPNSTQGR